MTLVIFPCTLKQANFIVSQWHRHHKPVQGHRFSIAVRDGKRVHGAAIVGRPVSRELPPYEVAEVTRLVTDGYKNACSCLYAACARIAKEMGFMYIQTYILDEETGVSLTAAGWHLDGHTTGGDWNHSVKFAAQGRRTDQPMGPKQRWKKVLNKSK